MRFSIQSTLKKFTTNAKTSCAFILGVNKSKLIITQTYFDAFPSSLIDPLEGLTM